MNTAKTFKVGLFGLKKSRKCFMKYYLVSAPDNLNDYGFLCDLLSAAIKQKLIRAT